MNIYSAAILSIGNELLSGKTVNTNAAVLGQKLLEAGYPAGLTLTVPDEPAAILDALRLVQNRFRLVILTGGLGPTKDDRTKNTLLEYFGGEWNLHAPTLAKLEDWYRRRNRVMNEPMRRQAWVPSTCEVLENTIGTAPGMWFEKEQSVFVSLPGIPAEMKLLMEQKVLTRMAAGGGKIVKRSVRLFGKPESEIASEMEPLEATFPPELTIAWLPTEGEVKIDLSIPADFPDAVSHLETAQKAVAALFEKFVFSLQDLTLPQALGAALQALGKTIGCAESCTGGALGALITSVSGSSAYFRGSIVAYHEDIKKQVLHIPAELMEAHTVVSAEVASAMAVNVREILGTDIAMATTGTAEVKDGDPIYGNAVIWVAVATAGMVKTIQVPSFQDRISNIRRAAKAALFAAVKALQQQ